MENNNHNRAVPPPLPGANRNKLRADSNSGVGLIKGKPANEDGGREVFNREAVLAQARSAAEAGNDGRKEVFDRAEVLRQAEQEAERDRISKLKKFVAEHPSLTGTKVPLSPNQSAKVSKFFSEDQVEVPPLGWTTAVYEGDVPESVLRKIDVLPPDEQQKAIDDWYATSGNETAEERAQRKLREKGELYNEVVKLQIESRKSRPVEPEKPKRQKLSTAEEVARIKADIRARELKDIEEVGSEHLQALPPKVTPEIKHGKLVSYLNKLFAKWKQKDEENDKRRTGGA